MKSLSNFLVPLIVALPLVAAADPLPKAVADMNCLVGSWKGGGSLAMGKDKAKIDATWTCKRVSSEFGVLCTFHVTGFPGMPLYDETDLFGYDPTTNNYHWYSVTNAGESHDHVAKIPDGNVIQFVATGTQDGKAFKETISLSFSKDEKTITGRAEAFVGGAQVSVMDLVLRKGAVS